mmetsp:Transcript_13683/g.14249  ORF Transcript_13683/g.14249 Transcript_13683/m.14249 type:complete len:166 (-) Transcript_13683:207-704(-)
MSRPESRMDIPSPNFISLEEVKGLIGALEEIVKDEAVLAEAIDEEINAFSVGRVPRINLESYFSRIIKYCKLEQGTFIAMMIYLDKVAEKIDLTCFNMHRLILAALVCAVKYTCDTCNNDSFFAKVGGVSVSELCVIESTFLALLEYSLYISDEENEKYSGFLRF